MKSIRVKATGVETAVSDDYFAKYAPEGWFIEIVELPEPEMLIIDAPKKTKKVIIPEA